MKKNKIIFWILSKLDKYNIKIIKPFEYDENCKNWAKD
jgi:hypothetical protein